MTVPIDLNRNFFHLAITLKIIYFTIFPGNCFQFPVIGDNPCGSSTTKSTTCVKYTECLVVNVTTRIQQQICGWEGKEPMVCCAKKFEKLINRDECVSILIPPLKSLTVRDAVNHMHKVAVVGGVNSKIGSWPWMAALFFKNAPSRVKPFCGGSLISSDSVLTAAHCFIGFETSSDFVVLLGDLKLGDASDGLHPVEIDVVTVKTHENYKYPAVYNDIAILRLKTKVKFTLSVGKICLPNQEMNNVQLEGASAVVTGWGHLKFGGAPSPTLQEAAVPVISNSKCNDIYRTILGGDNENVPSGITQNVICAGDEKGKKDACQGDSGGPLVYPHFGSSHWILIGVIASGFECGIGVPGIYTRVSEYLPWIEDNM